MKIANNATSTLAASITSGATSISIQAADAAKFPALAAGEAFPLTLVDTMGNMEICKVTARAGSALTVVRGTEGTTARAFPLGAKAELRLTAAAFNSKAEASALESKADASALSALSDEVDLKADAAGTAASIATKQDIATRGEVSGLRNEIINGDFDFWQRFTTSASWVSPVLNYYTADRWVAQSNGNGGAGAISQQAFAPGQTAVPGNPAYFLRWQITAAASGQTVGSCYIEQRMENVRRLSGGKATATIYLKGTGTLPSLNLVQAFGSGGSPPVVTQLDTNVALGAEWVKKQYLIDVPPISGKSLGSGHYTALNIQVPVNSTFTLDLAHVSTVPGDATGEANPFPVLHYQQIVAICRRFFRKYATAQNVGDLANEMRSTPAVSGSGPFFYDSEL